MLYDYVIVGGGSAGCVLANRLSADPAIRVCLLEAGKADTSPVLHIPAGTALTLPGRYHNWAFQTEPQLGLNGRRGYQPRGKVLGGSSAINAMIYIRGHPSDYDHWAALGNEGWSYREVLPYFLKAENNERGAGPYHGVGGPLNVADLRSPQPVTLAFLEAAVQAGFPRTDDFNGPQMEGVGLYQVTQVNGERCSVAKAYLNPVRGRGNLTVLTRANATRILFQGRRAVGVEYRQGGKTHIVSVRREVLLSAGALQSLLLSGVGPRRELERHGIPIVHELPGVGENLQDHIDYVACYRSKSKELFGFSPSGAVQLLRAWREYRRQRTGLLTTNYAEAGGFLRTDPALELPDVQLHFVIGIVDDHSRKLHFGHGYSCHVCVLRPRSRGRVALHGPDPLAPPLIDPNYFGEEEDLETLLRGYKLMRQIMEAPASAARIMSATAVA